MNIDHGQGSQVARIKKTVLIFAWLRVREYCKQYNGNVLNKMIRRKEFFCYTSSELFKEGYKSRNSQGVGEGDNICTGATIGVGL